MPARGDPGGRRLRRVRDPRPVDHRGAHRRHRRCARSRTRAATAASRSSRAAARARAGSRARSTAGATASTARTPHVTQRKTFAEHNLAPDDIDLDAGAVRGVGRVRVDQPRRRRAAAARVHRAVRDDPRRVEGGVAAHRVVVRVPAAGELEARASRRSSSSTTWSRRTRSSSSPTRFAPRDGDAVRPASVRRRRHPYLHAMSDGMDGMVHAERRAHRRGPARHRAARRRRRWRWRRGTARSTTRSCAGTGTRARDIPDLNELEAQGLNEPMGYCFPHFFVLPMYSSASSYRFRPLGPGGDADGDLVARAGSPRATSRRRPTPPEVWECDDPRWPPIPAQDFSNLPRQQQGLHAQGFEYMRLSERARGPHLELRADRSTASSPACPYERAAPRAAGGQREPARAADRRHRVLT